MAKPTQSKTIKEAVAQAIKYQTFLPDIAIRRVLSRVDFVPFHPKRWRNLFDEISKSEPDLLKIADIISLDTGMTAAILKIAISSYLDLPYRKPDAKEAVFLIGLEGVRALVQAYEALLQRTRIKIRNDLFNAISRHSLATALLAREIAKSHSTSEDWISNAFTAGMLHDVGCLELANNFQNNYLRALDVSTENRIPLWQAEGEILGSNHMNITAFLIGLWGFPLNIVEALAFHHTPQKMKTQNFNLCTVLHVADYLSNLYNESDITSGFHELNLDYLERTGCAGLLPMWQDPVSYTHLRAHET